MLATFVVLAAGNLLREDTQEVHIGPHDNRPNSDIHTGRRVAVTSDGFIQLQEQHDSEARPHNPIAESSFIAMTGTTPAQTTTTTSTTTTTTSTTTTTTSTTTTTTSTTTTTASTTTTTTSTTTTTESTTTTTASTTTTTASTTTTAVTTTAAPGATTAPTAATTAATLQATVAAPGVPAAATPASVTAAAPVAVSSAPATAPSASASSVPASSVPASSVPASSVPASSAPASSTTVQPPAASQETSAELVMSWWMWLAIVGGVALLIFLGLYLYAKYGRSANPVAAMMGDMPDGLAVPGFLGMASNFAGAEDRRDIYRQQMRDSVATARSDGISSGGKKVGGYASMRRIRSATDDDLSPRRAGSDSASIGAATTGRVGRRKSYSERHRKSRGAHSEEERPRSEESQEHHSERHRSQESEREHEEPEAVIAPEVHRNRQGAGAHTIDFQNLPAPKRPTGGEEEFFM